MSTAAERVRARIKSVSEGHPKGVLTPESMILVEVGDLTKLCVAWEAFAHTAPHAAKIIEHGPTA